MQTTRQVANEATGYAGPLADGHWLYAATLQAGDRLLNADGTWAEVLGAEAVNEPLLAYNLTVEGFHTYFVAGDAGAAPVWVHNDCFPDVNRIINSNMAHATDAKRLGRVGMDSQIQARVALQELGNSLKTNGLPVGAIPHRSMNDRVFIPFGNGYALYSFNSRGRYRLETLVSSRMPFELVVE